MNETNPIPIFNLFGETSAFPDVVHCERIFDRARLHGWKISPHRHSQMAQLFHIETGAAEVTLDGRDSRLNAGEFLYLPPKIVHGFAFERSTEGIVLSLPSAVIQRLAPQTPLLRGWLTTLHHAALSDTAADLLARLVQFHNMAGTFRAQRLVALSHALLSVLAEETHQGETRDHDPNRQMQRLDTLISEHLSEGWSATEYARALHMTAGHLNRIVRAESGMTLSNYLETAVMTEACRYLAFTRLPILEVGYRLGYTDPPYFSRRFRLRMGETPSQYRNRVAGEV